VALPALLAACAPNPYAPIESADRIQIDISGCDACTSTDFRVTAHRDGTFLYQNVWSKPDAGGVSPRVAAAMKTLANIGSDANGSVDAKQLPEGLQVSVAPNYSVKLEPGAAYPNALAGALAVIWGTADAAAAAAIARQAQHYRGLQLQSAHVFLGTWGACGFDATFNAGGTARVRYWGAGAGPAEKQFAVPFQSIRGLMNVYGVDAMWGAYRARMVNAGSARMDFAYAGGSRRILVPDLNLAPPNVQGFLAAAGGLVATGVDARPCSPKS
jgi:hypothetical protein